MTLSLSVLPMRPNAGPCSALRTLVSGAGLGVFGGTEPDIEIANASNGDFVVRRTKAGSMASQRGAIQQSLEIARRRIDEVGVAEPTIQGLGADRILVQLPRVQDPARIKTLFGQHCKADVSSGKFTG